jgi:MarR family transcriptional regulator, transcriptional regulator for hemolysin
MHQVDTETLGFLVADVSRLIRAEFDRRIAEAGIGLTPGEGRALLHAARAGAVRQNVLAERMGLEAMTLSGYLDRLEARGLVKRRPDPTDRRAKLIELTDAAEAAIEEIQAIAASVRAEAARSIAPEDWIRFLATLKIVRNNLSGQRSEAARKVETSAA